MSVALLIPLKDLDGEDSWTDNDLEIPIPVAALI